MFHPGNGPVSKTVCEQQLLWTDFSTWFVEIISYVNYVEFSELWILDGVQQIVRGCLDQFAESNEAFSKQGER